MEDVHYYVVQRLHYHCNFHELTTNHITTKLTNPTHDPRHKYHHLTMTLHLTLKMTTAQVVETSVTTNNSLSKDYPHPGNHATQTTDYIILGVHNLKKQCQAASLTNVLAWIFEAKCKITIFNHITI